MITIAGIPLEKLKKLAIQERNKYLYYATEDEINNQLNKISF